jgi:hypothetical protein
VFSHCRRRRRDSSLLLLGLRFLRGEEEKSPPTRLRRADRASKWARMGTRWRRREEGRGARRDFLLLLPRVIVVVVVLVVLVVLVFSLLRMTAAVQGGGGEVPAYSAPTRGSGVEVGSNGYALEKKGGVFLRLVTVFSHCRRRRRDSSLLLLGLRFLRGRRRRRRSPRLLGSDARIGRRSGLEWVRAGEEGRRGGPYDCEGRVVISCCCCRG